MNHKKELVAPFTFCSLGSQWRHVLKLLSAMDKDNPKP